MNFEELLENFPSYQFEQIQIDDSRIKFARNLVEGDLDEYYDGNIIITCDDPIWVALGRNMKTEATKKLSIYSCAPDGTIYQTSINGRFLNLVKETVYRKEKTLSIVQTSQLSFLPKEQGQKDFRNISTTINKEEITMANLESGVPRDKEDKKKSPAPPAAPKKPVDSSETQIPKEEVPKPPKEEAPNIVEEKVEAPEPVKEGVTEPEKKSPTPPRPPGPPTPPGPGKSNSFTSNVFDSNGGKDLPEGANPPPKETNPEDEGEDAGKDKKKQLSPAEKERRRKKREDTVRLTKQARKIYTEIKEEEKDFSGAFREAQALLKQYGRISVFVTQNEKGHIVSSADKYPDPSKQYDVDQMKTYIIKELFNKKIVDVQDRQKFYTEGRLPTSARPFLRSEIDIVIKETSTGKEQGAYVKNLAPFDALSSAGRKFTDAEVEALKEALESGVQQVSFKSIPDIYQIMRQFRSDIQEDEEIAIGGVPAMYGARVPFSDTEFAKTVNSKEQQNIPKKIRRKENGKTMKSLLTEKNYIPIKVRKTFNLVNDPLTAEQRDTLIAATFGKYNTKPADTASSSTSTTKKKNERAHYLSTRIKRLTEKASNYLSHDEKLGKFDSIIFSGNPANRQLEGLFPTNEDGSSTMPSLINIPMKTKEVTKNNKVVYRPTIYSLVDAQYASDAEYRAQCSVNLDRYSEPVRVVGTEMFETPEEVMATLKTTTSTKVSVDVYDMLDYLAEKNKK